MVSYIKVDCSLVQKSFAEIQGILQSHKTQESNQNVETKFKLADRLTPKLFSFLASKIPSACGALFCQGL